MSIRIVRLGSERAPAEGLRIGTVRRPPRGVPKNEFASRNFYDVWLPNLAPSEALRTATEFVDKLIRTRVEGIRPALSCRDEGSGHRTRSGHAGCALAPHQLLGRLLLR